MHFITCDALPKKKRIIIGYIKIIFFRLCSCQKLELFRFKSLFLINSYSPSVCFIKELKT